MNKRIRKVQFQNSKSILIRLIELRNEFLKLNIRPRMSLNGTTSSYQEKCTVNKRNERERRGGGGIDIILDPLTTPSYFSENANANAKKRNSLTILFEATGYAVLLLPSRYYGLFHPNDELS